MTGTRSWRLLDDDPMSGIKQWFRYIDETDSWQIWTQQDTEPVLEQNKRRQADGTGGWTTKEKDWRHAACIPDIVAMKWLKEDGVWLHNKAHWPAIAKKLDSSEYRYLRTADFRIGKRARQL